MTPNELIAGFKQSNTANYKAGRTKSVQYIVIHYTANNVDTAQNNLDYFARESVGASAHLFVDKQYIRQSVKFTDTAWHCGGSSQGSGGKSVYGLCTNSNSIGIEMCSQVIGGKMSIPDATVENTLKITRALMAAYNIPANRVVRHYDVTGKQCPYPFIADTAQWESFKKRLEDEELTQTQFNEMFMAMRKDLKDNDSGTWSKEAREWAVANGLIAGNGTTVNGEPNCMWEDLLTREQFVAVLHRFAQLMGKV